MARQSFATEAFSPADPKTVFDVLADVPRWREWAGPMIRQSMYERQGSPEAGGVGAIRKLGAPPVWGREEIVEYEPPHHLAYVMLSGQPVRNYRAEVDLSPTDGGTRITWRSSFDPLVPGTGGLMRMILSRIVAGLARRLAAHAGRSGS